MVKRSLRILQVSTHDIAGGAEKIAWNLFKTYQLYGYDSWLAVGNKRSENTNVLLFQNNKYRSFWTRFLVASGKILSPLVGKIPGIGLLQYWLRWIREPKRFFSIQQGYEDFDFPATWRLLEFPDERPEIIHCHNLHGGYFDLSALAWLSHQVPAVLTLHDAWLLSGHCAHSFDCEKWKIGCGQCPDLTISPVIKRDGTAYNWQRKKKIYAKSRLYVATPSQWLMKKVEQSILMPAIVEAKVIPNGVDLSVFHPTEKQAVRTALGISQNTKVLLFTANGIRNSIWKDYQTMQAAVGKVSECLQGQDILFIALGEDALPEKIGHAEVHFIPYQKNPEYVARYYQAADIYIHAARIETFPNTVLESLACGIPVVATAVGGIPEQIQDGITGYLTPPGDADVMAAKVIQLLKDEGMKQKMSEQAAKDAKKRFDLKKQVKEYMGWYEKIIDEWKPNTSVKNH